MNPILFDRARLAQHRRRAAPKLVDFLFAEMAERLADRLPDIKRSFPLALDLGAHTGQLAAALGGRGCVETLVQTDLSEAMLIIARNARGAGSGLARPADRVQSLYVVADEEFLPFADNSFDAVFSAGSLHWVNDLPGTLIQINRCLKPGGLFLAILPGGQTLKELRQSFEAAEMEMKSGLSPRVSPFVEVKDAGALLQRAGFQLPVADSETLTVSYAHPLKLLHELRDMGEASALAQSAKGFTPCSLMMGMVDRYLRDFSDEEGRIPASFELVTLTGWKKD